MNSNILSNTMANLNKVILIGHLTRDPEVRYTPKGTAVAEFALAVNRTYTSEQGEKREDATFVDITVWAHTAELAKRFLTKGRQVYVEGRLDLSTWDDKQTGKKRSKLSVIGENLQFLDSRQDTASIRPHTRASSQNTRPTALSAVSYDDEDRIDIPF